ncbi:MULTISPECIES: cellulose biosynthesis protein BcsD [Rheinheimera]|uniref:Cellulose biosynthesis protein BcsD n=1 Tax=Rheinheimera marina TaxID=1774958 RepID=A0ABV9JJU9_9GAMM
MTDMTDITTDYFFRQQTKAAWVPFIRAFVAEIAQTAGEAGADSFLRQIGKRLAADYPLAQYNSIDELERSMNVVLQELQWGWLRIQVLDSSLMLKHGAFPLPSYGNEQQQRFEARLFSALLEGLYQSWLLALGGKPDVQVRVKTAEAGGVFEFVYGKSRLAHSGRSPGFL